MNLAALIWALQIYGTAGGGGGGGSQKIVTFQSAAINAKTSGAVPLFTTASGKFDFLIPQSVSIIVPSVNSAVGPTALSIGSNDPEYDDLLGAYDFSGLTTQYDVQPIPFGKTALLAGGLGTALQANISGVAVGTAMSLVILLTCTGINL